MKKRAKICVGATYHIRYGGVDVVGLVLAECIATTVRFKRDVPGWRILILEGQGVYSTTRPGVVVEWPKTAELFKYATVL